MNVLNLPAQQPIPPLNLAPVNTLSWNDIRHSRNVELQMTDWTSLPDSPLTQEQKQKWSVYRQQLRDITKVFPTPNHVIWPTKPQ
jgi:hypothetical protein